jgi:uncharacterized lipoprotein YmbA
MKAILVLGALFALAGCGVSETATSAAVAAKTKAQEVEQAKQIEQKVVGDIQKSQQLEEQRLRDADSAGSK